MNNSMNITECVSTASLMQELHVFDKEFGSLLPFPNNCCELLDFTEWQWACLRFMYMYISSRCSDACFYFPNANSIEDAEDIDDREESNIVKLYMSIIPNSSIECYGWSMYDVSIDRINNGFNELREFFNDPELLLSLSDVKDSNLVLYFNEDLHSFISKSKNNLDKFLEFSNTYSRYFGMYEYVATNCFPETFLITKKGVYYGYYVTFDNDNESVSLDFSPATFFVARELYKLSKEVF